MDYAIIVTTIGLGAGVTACIVRHWFNSFGEQDSEYEAVVQGQGGTCFLGGHKSREAAIREANRTVSACRSNGMNKSAVRLVKWRGG